MYTYGFSYFRQIIICEFLSNWTKAAEMNGFPVLFTEHCTSMLLTFRNHCAQKKMAFSFWPCSERVNCIKWVKSISIRCLLNGQSSGRECCWQKSSRKRRAGVPHPFEVSVRERKGAEKDLRSMSDAGSWWYRFQPQDKRVITVWKWNWATCTSWEDLTLYLIEK